MLQHSRKDVKTKLDRHNAWNYSVFTYCSFDSNRISIIIMEVTTVTKTFARFIRTCIKEN